MRINPYKNKCEQSRVSMKDCNNNNNIIIITDIGDQNFIGEKYNPKQQLPIFCVRNTVVPWHIQDYLYYL